MLWHSRSPLDVLDLAAMEHVYGGRYKRIRRTLLGKPCTLRIVCNGAPADSADHDPPLALHVHVPGSGCCRLRPACQPCQHAQGSRLRRRKPQQRRIPLPSRRW